MEPLRPLKAKSWKWQDITPAMFYGYSGSIGL